MAQYQSLNLEGKKVGPPTQKDSITANRVTNVDKKHSILLGVVGIPPSRR